MSFISFSSLLLCPLQYEFLERRVKRGEVKVAQSYPTLCNPMDYTVHGILQARILEWVVFPFSRGSFQSSSPALRADSLPAEPPGKPLREESKSESEVTQSCPTLCNQMDCSPPGSFILGIFQARVVEWVTISFSRGSSQPRD